MVNIGLKATLFLTAVLLWAGCEESAHPRDGSPLDATSEAGWIDATLGDGPPRDGALEGLVQPDGIPDKDARAIDTGPADGPATPDSRPVRCKGQWFDLGDRILAGITISYNGATASLGPVICGSSQMTRSVSAGGKALAQAALRPTARGAELILTTTQGGTYRAGVVINAAKIKALDDRMTPITRSTAVGWRRYPYDWESSTKTTTYRDPDLMLPGLMANSSYLAVATKGLTAIRFVWHAGASTPRAILYAHREQNQGWDSATHGLVLKAGATVKIAIDVAPSYRALLDLRHSRPRPISGTMVQIPFKGWSAGINLSRAQTELIARRFRGAFSWVQLRTLRPEKWIPAIFHRVGLKLQLYQFWGAARDCARPGTAPAPCESAVKKSWLLNDSTGKPYRGGNRNWLLLDLRQKVIRSWLVARAVRAIRNGWDGIFLDGPFFWIGSDGHVGGASTAQGMSWARARYRLLDELREQVAQNNPNARIGMLAPPRYIDHVHRNDYVLKEGLNFAWQIKTGTWIPENPMVRITVHGPSKSAEWMQRTYPRIANALYLGSKGANPLLVHSAIRWAVANPPRIYLDVGDFWAGASGHPDFTSAWSETVASVAEHDKTIIAKLSPTTSALEALGTSRVRVSSFGSGRKITTRVTFNRDVAVFREADLRLLGTVNRTINLVPGQTYRFAERLGTGGWSWTNYGFVHRSASCYGWGKVRFFATPRSTATEAIFTLRGTGPNTFYLRIGQRPTAVYLRKLGNTGWSKKIGNWMYDGRSKTFSYPRFPSSAVYELRVIGACR